MINQYQKSLLLIFLLFSTILLGKNKKTLIEAQDDTYTVTYSSEPQTVGSVYDNDRYGTATPTDKEVQFSYVRRSTDDNGKYISTIRGGMLRLPAGLAVGRHYVYYKIRDIKDATLFATATATVIVLPQITTPTTETPTTSTSTTTTSTTTPTTTTLTAQDDTYTVTYSTESKLVGSVYDNDRYGTATPTDKEVQFSYIRRSTDDRGKYISTTRGGMLRLPAGLAVGRHYVYYKIRDIKDATHFATATATVIVLPQTTTPTTETPTTSTATTTPTITTSTTITLTAQDDTYTVTYSTEPQIVGSVYDNDRYGTQTPTDKEVQFSYIRRSTDNNGKYISTIRGGTLRLPAGLSVGRHYIYYKIRDIKDVTHFATATATIIVLPQTTTPTTKTPTTTATTTSTTITLTAQDDTYTVTYSNEPQIVGSVYDNDRYGTQTPTDKEVHFSYIHRSTDNNGKFISTIRGGMLRLLAGLSVGRHYIYYKIRDIKDVTHFATATATVIVLPQTTTPTTETPTTSTATTTSTTTTLTAQDDTYTITYSNESQTVGSVYDNDRYGTATPTDKEVQFSYVRRSTDNNGKYISTTRGGMLSLPAGLSVGHHYVYYKIRDIKDVTHFATATATVIVLPKTTTPTTEMPTTSTSTTTTSTTTTLTAQDDTYTVTYSSDPQTVGSVYDNDRYGTATPTDKEVHFSYIRRSTDDNGKYISTTRGGMLRLPAGLAVGRHYVYYKIRDIKDVTHFATATATVIVLPQTTTPTTETPTTSTSTTTSTTITLTAQDDTYTVTYSTEPQLVGSVYDNDRYGTATPTDKEVHFSYVRRSTDDNGKYISTTRGGMLQLPAALSVGHHYVYYKIRDIKDVTHLATATATVIVLPQTTTPTTTTNTTTATTTTTTITLTAQDDTYTVTYSSEPQTVGSVYDNDRYGTATPTDKEVHFSYVRRSTDNNGKYISTIRGGMLRLPAGLSVGRHYVYYKIRDIKDATHSATATATVVVLPQTTTPTTETPTTSTSTTTTSTTTATTTPTTTTLTAQDDTYTVTYSTESQLVGSVYDNDRYGTQTPTDKEVQFSYVRRSTDNNGKYISTIRGGMLRLPAGLSVGRHYVYYKIRDIKDATHSATATATVVVLPQTTTPTTETPTTSTATTTPTTTTSTTITLTAQDDTYTVTYSTENQLVGSVYDNDRYGTATPTDKEVQFSYIHRSTDDNGKYISTTRGGMLRLPAGLAVGRHYVYYKIRDIKDATHFATATATVIVLPQTTTPTTSTATTTPTTTTSTTIPLTAQDDTYTVTYSTEPQMVGSVYDNDRYGTATPTDKEVQFSYVRRSTDNNGKFISIGRGGMLRLPAGLSVGRHYVYYKIRDIKDATHFATATATVIVLPQTTTPTTSTSTTTPTTETPTTSTSTTTPTTTTSTTITLTAQDDTYIVTYSNEPQTVGSVYDNDHYGTATPTDKEVQFSYVRRNTDNNGKYISTGRGGMLRLPAGLSVGHHYVYYKIRDIKDATHFASATATVIVLPQTTTPTTETPTTSTSTTTSTTITLTAQDDTYTVTYSTDPQIVGSVYDNDRYGTQTPTDKEVHFSYVRRSTDNNGKYISTTRGGMLQLPAGLSVGRHYVYYKIRDIKNTTHFATATATVIVLPQTTTPTTETPTTSTATTTTSTTIPLTAQDDTYTVTYSTEFQIVGSVYDNDHYGTQTPTDKEVQFSYIHRSTDNNGKYISTTRGGMLHLPVGLAVGRHYIYYKIRDIKDATHFATATATVIVLPQITTPTTETPTTSTSTTTPTTTTNTTITLTAQDDTYTVTYSTESQLVGSVYDNDHYGTATPTDKEVQFSYIRRSTDDNGKYISIGRGGMLSLPAGLAVGRHYVYYKIRDIKDVTHFATATATVIVLPQITTPTTETPTTSTTTTTPTTTTLTAQDDTYTVTYSNEPQLVGSVYDNDHYGTQTPTDKEVQFSYVRRSTDNNGKYISTVRGGMLRLPAGLSVGRHYIYYKIRDIKDATHFATATATVIVLPQTTTPTTTTLTAQDDTYTVTYSSEPQTVGSVYDNDRYGTATPTDKEVHLSYVRRSTDDNGKYISTASGGMLRLPAGLAEGRHYVYYKIRDIKDATHFATATATVIVLPQTTTPTAETPTTSTSTTTPTTTTNTTITLTAQDDTYTVTYSNEPQTVGSVYDNDRYGTATPTDKEVQFLKLSSSVDNNGKYISTAQGGMLHLPAGLSVGRHYVYYKIRDIKDITNFATATVTVIVLPQTTTPTTKTPTTSTATTTPTTTTSTTITLTAQDDTYTVTYSTESQLVGSVYDNDRYGTATPTDKEVQFSYVRRSTDNNGKYISTTRGGMLRLPAGLSVGRHYVYYKIRDIKDATHSATATATVIVLPKTTTPTTSTATTTPTTTTSTTITLTAQDDIYTVTYSTEAQIVGSVYDNDRYGTQTPTDKEVQFLKLSSSVDKNGKYISTAQGGMLRVPAGLSVGQHYLLYKIREIQNLKNFAIATATIVVLPKTTTPTTASSTSSTATATTASSTTTSSTTTPTIKLTAQDDTYTVTYSIDPQLVGSVYDNDRYGTATPTDKEVQFSYVRRSTDNNGKYISTTRGGMLRLPAGLSVGRHYVYYKIRDIKDATHSATATATVIVLPKTTTPTTITLTAQDDTYTVTYSTESQLVGSVYDNDHYGTATPTDKEVQFSYIHRSTDDNGKYISTIRGGMLRLPAGLSVGRHYVYYKIRDIKDVTHFATATATVIVMPQTTTPTTSTSTTTTSTTTSTTTTLTAQDDTYTVTYSTEPQLVGSVYDNDYYGTATPTDKEVQFSYVRRSTDNNGKYISTTQGGMLRLPAGLSVGRHYVYYKIRDIKDVTHFATATATVIVLPTTTTPTTSTATTTPTTTTLTAQDDTYTVTYSTENQLVGSVYDNDRYGTATPTDKEVQFSYVRRSTDDNGKYISTTRGGMLHLPADLAVGRHYVYYKIRDIKDVTHFATATATVIVLPQTTTPTTETPTTEEPLRPIAVADAVTTPMNTPVLIAILQNDIPYDAVPYISAFPYKGSVTLNDSNEVLYTPNNNTTGADSFTYELRSPDAAISLATTTVTVKIWSPITPCTGISANGDGKNDYFHIMGIENYPENTLTIYDSNANEVFSVSHYDNKVCRFEGANLPQGVYFFVLTYRDEDDNLEQQVGWFYLKK